MSTKQNNCSVFRIHRNTITRQITALPPILSERKNARSQFLLKARCMGQHRAMKAAASCAGSCRTAAVFCGNYAVLPNGCLAPLVFGLSGSLRGIPSHRAEQIWEGWLVRNVPQKRNVPMKYLFSKGVFPAAPLCGIAFMPLLWLYDTVFSCPKYVESLKKP